MSWNGTITRRQSIAAAGTAAGAAALGGTAAAATVWVEPGLERPQDAPSLANPVDMD